MTRTAGSAVTTAVMMLVVTAGSSGRRPWGSGMVGRSWAGWSGLSRRDPDDGSRAADASRAAEAVGCMHVESGERVEYVCRGVLWQAPIIGLPRMAQDGDAAGAATE